MPRGIPVLAHKQHVLFAKTDVWSKRLLSSGTAMDMAIFNFYYVSFYYIAIIKEGWCYISRCKIFNEKGFRMKKIISVIAMMAFVSGQAFAQATPATPAEPAVPGESAAVPATPAEPARPARPGLSVAAMVSVGIALAAVAAVASDDSETPASHAATTHH